VILPSGNPVASVSLRTAVLALPRALARPRQVAIDLATAAVLCVYEALFTILQLGSVRGVAAFPVGLQGLRVATLPPLLVVVLLLATLHRIAPLRRAVAGFLLAAAAAVVVAVCATALHGAFVFVGGSLRPVLAHIADGSGSSFATLLVALLALTGAGLTFASRQPSQGAARPAGEAHEQLRFSHEQH
jgi:hypothetical protein